MMRKLMKGNKNEDTMQSDPKTNTLETERSRIIM